MKKLIIIEWYKWKASWFNLLSIPIYFILLGFLYKMMGNFNWGGPQEGMSITANQFGLYKKPIVWESLSYLAGFMKYFAVFVFMLFVAGDYQHKLIRQHITDGLGRTKYALSKWIFPVFFVGLHIIFIYIMAEILAEPGGEFSTKAEVTWYFPFLWALEFLVLLSLGFFLVHLTRKGGISVIILLLYSLIVEPITEFFTSSFSYVFPLHHSRALIGGPINRIRNEIMFEREIPISIPVESLWLSVFYILLFAVLGWFLVKRRDV